LPQRSHEAGSTEQHAASKVPLPNPNNERDRILSEEEWQKLCQVAKPHLRPILTVAYQLGQRLGEIMQ